MVSTTRASQLHILTHTRDALATGNGRCALQTPRRRAVHFVYAYGDETTQQERSIYGLRRSRIYGSGMATEQSTHPRDVQPSVSRRGVGKMIDRYRRNKAHPQFMDVSMLKTQTPLRLDQTRHGRSHQNTVALR